jgi:hypothetical protein
MFRFPILLLILAVVAAPTSSARSDKHFRQARDKGYIRAPTQASACCPPTGMPVRIGRWPASCL